MSHHLAILMALMVSTVCATDYHVGPTQTFTNINDVPLESLGAGDTLYIHYRSTPYREKFVLCAVGTSTSPLVVTGVPEVGTGKLPMIDASGATTRQSLDYWSEQRCAIKIGGSSAPSCTRAEWVRVENLDIYGAVGSNTFTDDGGTSTAYADNAASIYLEHGKNIEIRGCAIHGSGNGLFVAKGVSGAWTTNVTVAGNRIYGNGVVGSFYEHNTYTEAVGITYEGNWFGPLCAGCLGNNLKDRSAGTVVRYNWFDGGNRQMDLVDGGAEFAMMASYMDTYVYGNVITELTDDGNRQHIHFGFDGNPVQGRGTLHVYYNTFVSERTGRTTLVRLSSAAQTANFYNNVIYTTAAANELEILADALGTALLDGNWVRAGFVNSFAGAAAVTEQNTVNPSPPETVPVNVTTMKPVTALPGVVSVPAAVWTAHPVTQTHGGMTRTSLTDMGAYPYAQLPPPPPPVSSPPPPPVAMCPCVYNGFVVRPTRVIFGRMRYPPDLEPYCSQSSETLPYVVTCECPC
eukprot:TRINITY_DN645_c0_g2_i1.p1 TRINITY_DN645_c0_g2~~TRINITY_DN645_c0_g2_i1.p1  ORF type:complete len:518 (-),score=105.52 TRINITY_DN645_c0_g2_i1:449-2002(-)